MKVKTWAKVLVSSACTDYAKNNENLIQQYVKTSCSLDSYHGMQEAAIGALQSPPKEIIGHHTETKNPKTTFSSRFVLVCGI